MAVQVSVIGSGSEWEEEAAEVGRLLAERGCTVVTGGLGIHFERMVPVAHDDPHAQAYALCIRVDAEPVDGVPGVL